MCIRVMLETNTIKFAATKLRMLIPANRLTYNAKGEVTGFLLLEDGYINPNDKITDPELRREADLLPEIAELAKNGKVELLLDRQTTWEMWGVPKINSPDGLFFGAPIIRVGSPAQRNTPLVHPDFEPEDLATKFFTSISNERFKKLAKICGAYQGENNWKLNQLWDAFYIWSAEHNGCEYLLTLDFKLMRMLSHAKNYDAKVKVVKPSELLEQATKRGGKAQKPCRL
jgi:hypothetical protein